LTGNISGNFMVNLSAGSFFGKGSQTGENELAIDSMNCYMYPDSK
jgi:hypothetical protein